MVNGDRATVLGEQRRAKSQNGANPAMLVLVRSSKPVERTDPCLLALWLLQTAISINKEGFGATVFGQ